MVTRGAEGKGADSAEGDNREHQNRAAGVLARQDRCTAQIVQLGKGSSTAGWLRPGGSVSSDKAGPTERHALLSPCFTVASHMNADTLPHSSAAPSPWTGSPRYPHMCMCPLCTYGAEHGRLWQVIPPLPPLPSPPIPVPARQATTAAPHPHPTTPQAPGAARHTP